MILYEVGPMDDRSLFFATKAEAIKEAQAYGDAESMYVEAVDIGKLTKDVACRLASGKGFVISRKHIWGMKPEPLENKPPYDYAADDLAFDAAREDRIFGRR